MKIKLYEVDATYEREDRSLYTYHYLVIGCSPEDARQRVRDFHAKSGSQATLSGMFVYEAVHDDIYSLGKGKLQ